MAKNAFIKSLQIQWNFLLTDWLEIKIVTNLMPSDKCNLITAKAMGFIFSLLGSASAREVPFGIIITLGTTVYMS